MHCPLYISTSGPSIFPLLRRPEYEHGDRTSKTVICLHKGTRPRLFLVAVVRPSALVAVARLHGVILRSVVLATCSAGTECLRALSYLLKFRLEPALGTIKEYRPLALMK